MNKDKSEQITRRWLTALAVVAAAIAWLVKLV